MSDADRVYLCDVDSDEVAEWLAGLDPKREAFVRLLIRNSGINGQRTALNEVADAVEAIRKEVSGDPSAHEAVVEVAADVEHRRIRLRETAETLDRVQRDRWILRAAEDAGVGVP